MSLTLIIAVICICPAATLISVLMGCWLEARYWTESAKHGETVEHRGRLYGVWEVPQ